MWRKKQCETVDPDESEQLSTAQLMYSQPDSQ